MSEYHAGHSSLHKAGDFTGGRRLADVESAGYAHSGAVPAIRGTDDVPLAGLQGGLEIAHILVGRCGTVRIERDVARQILRQDDVAFGSDDALLHSALQFAHIARPGIGAQQIPRLRAETLAGSVFGIGFPQKKSRRAERDLPAVRAGAGYGREKY